MASSQQPHADHYRYVIPWREGDKEVMTKLYQENYERIYKSLIKKGLTEEYAKGCFLDGLVDVLFDFEREGEKSEEEEEFILTAPASAYLYIVCKNKSYEKFREIGKTPLRIDENKHLGSKEYRKGAEHRACWNALIWRTFLELSEKCRNIFELYDDKVNADDIARLLEIPTSNAVYAAKTACRKKWQNLIENDKDFPTCKPDNW